MRNRCIITALLFLFSTFSVWAQQPVLAVKFRADSPSFAAWKAAGRTGTINLFSRMFGRHETRPLVGDATLKTIRKQEQSAPFRRAETIAGEMARLCAVEFPAGMNVALFAGKLRGQPDVEYAEILPERRFVAEPPNDPFLDRLYHLNVVRAFEAWELIDTAAAPVVLAIVDTGVDYLHEDLAPVMYVNPGEDGLDGQGRNKRSNGVDDDDNGYIDDWHGWDFVSSTSPDGRDNDPMPGNPHGTHVAGIAGAAVNNGIGVAGAAIGVRLMAVKVGNDAGSNSVANSYDGLLYAAAAGAGVINCSWGGNAGSESEADVVRAVQRLGAVIVAAAGNSGANEAFYPAAYPGVLSVAATDLNNVKTGFSNFHGTVDVCAPGLSIYSTYPGNSYAYESGTSMASPVAAGLAALVRNSFPAYTPEQVAAHIKATTLDIDTLNRGFEGKIGTGRVEFVRALTVRNAKSALLASYRLTDESGDGVFSPGERVTASLTVRNVLAPLGNAELVIAAPPSLGIQAAPASVHLGALATGAEITPAETFSFVIPTNIPPDYTLEWTVVISDSGAAMRDYFAMTVNPTFRTMNANNLAVTFNSRGNIAYNDYPANTQGDGFSYKKGANILYEGALMVGTSEDRLSDVARSANQEVQSASFRPDALLSVRKPGEASAMDGSAVFSDARGANDAGVRVAQHCYQFTGAGRENFVIVAYDLTNATDSAVNTLHAGLYFDWDVGVSGGSNIVTFDGKSGYGYVYNAADSGLPYAAAALLTDQPLNFFAIDNGSQAKDNPGVYDGFTREEKWFTMSGGLGRLASSQTDASMVIAAGPMALAPGQTVRVAFALGAGDTPAALAEAMRSARETAAEFNLASGFRFTPLPETPALTALLPNAVGAESICTAQFYLPDEADVALRFSDVGGREVSAVALGSYAAGMHRVRLDVAGLAQGLYFARLYAGGPCNALPLTIVR